MAGLASKVSGTQMVEFFSRFGRFGGDMVKFQRLLSDDEFMEWWVKLMDQYPDNRLVHGVFNKPRRILADFKARCIGNGIDFNNFSWLGSETAPDFDPNDPETVVVLDATLDTLQNTFEFAWAWMADWQMGNHRSHDMLSDQKSLRLLSDERDNGSEGDGLDFKPWTLTWRRIKLDVNIGKKPSKTRTSKSPPGCALLFMGAEHPHRIKTMNYTSRFGFWLPGLKCITPNTGEWRRVPFILFDQVGHQVKLSLGSPDRSGDNLTIPYFRE